MQLPSASYVHCPQHGAARTCARTAVSTSSEWLLGKQSRAKGRTLGALEEILVINLVE